MKNVGIITLWGNTNYGNRLQNLATEYLIAELGLSPYTLVLKSPAEHADKITRIKAGIAERIRTPLLRLRRKSFDSFNSTYLHPVGMEYVGDCSAFVCGSDQIWNYTFPEFSPAMFLSFAGGRRTCALAASFGVDSVPKELIGFYTEMLAGVEYISVREEAGAKLVSEITGREVDVLVDPTMAVGRTTWEKLISSEAEMGDRYVFDYFIGTRPHELNNRIESELGYNKIVSFNNKRAPEWFAEGPLSFVNAIAHSDVVVTDSFHGVAFSIIFNRPFVVYERNTSEKSMSSRIDTILNKFDMGVNRESGLVSLAGCKSPGQEAQLILEQEQAKVADFLNRALGDVA